MTSASVANVSAVPGGSLTSALQALANEDPPAIAVSVFGTTRVVAFSASQITASNSEAPKYIWSPPAAVTNFAIGPDGALYNTSSTLTGGLGIARFLPRLSSGDLRRYKVANLTASTNGVLAFYSQAPRSGIDPRAVFAPNASGGARLGAGSVVGSTVPEWASLTTFTYSPATPTDAAFDQDGNIWVAVTTGAALVRMNVTGAGGAIVADVHFAGSNWPGSSQGVAVAANGDVWRSNYAAGAGTLRMVTAAQVTAAIGAGSSNTVPTVIITSTDLTGAEFIAFDYSGNLWAVSYDNTRILRFAAADLTSSGAKTPDIILTGGGTLGNGSATGPLVIRFFPGFGPVR
jgi:hypothetical protein